MNTAIYTQSMGSQGVGFAMPSNVLAKVYNDLIGTAHKVIRGSIGIQFQAATSSAVSRVYGFSSGGVIVSVITPNGGAAKGGIKPGDILTSVGGHQIKDGDDLVNDISARAVGSSVEIGYLRENQKHTASVTVGDRAKVYADIAGNVPEDEAPAPVDAGQAKLGITVSAVPAAVATKMGISGGVIVTNVSPGSFADEIGLPKGDVILEINRQAVTDDATYKSAVSHIKTGDDVVFVVRNPQVRGGGNNFVGGTLR
jgi:serine protease Do